MIFLALSHFFNVLTLLYVFLAILNCLLVIKLPISYTLKYISIPLILLLTFVLVVGGADLLGRAYDSRPKGVFEFKDYRVFNEKGAKKIELWVIQEKRSRLYVFPYTEKMEQDLAKAKTRKQKSGGEQRGSIRSEAAGGMDDMTIVNTLPPKGD